MTTEKQTDPILKKKSCTICAEEHYGSGKNGVCRTCIRSVETDLANLTVLRHLRLGLICFFNFKFVGAFGCFTWAIERAFKIGDYHPETGYWYTSKILKRKTKNL